MPRGAGRLLGALGGKTSSDSRVIRLPPRWEFCVSWCCKRRLIQEQAKAGLAVARARSRSGGSQKTCHGQIGTLVSDLSPLAGLTGLRFLCVEGTQVQDLTSLVGLRELKWVNLSGTQVSDLTPLAGLSVNRLDLSGTQVSNVTSLGTLVNLQRLDLSDTSVSDVSSLTRLKNLQQLNLSDTPVIQADVERMLPQINQ